MSFILDALRKSDTERQQQATPGLATTAQRTQGTNKNIWIPLLTAVLILNAAALAWILMTDTNEATGVPAPSSAQPDTRSLRVEAEAVATPGKAAAPAPAISEPVIEMTPVPAPVPAQPATQDLERTAAPEQADTETIQTSLPSFDQLLAGGIVSMPPLHLDIHVYAGEPAKRFVFINMNKYREGERLNEGPLVEEITNDGVILNQRGNRFTLESN